MKHVTQEERLDYLVEEFKTDSGEYRNIDTPKDTEGKRRVLRSLMNIRMPRNISSDVLRVQDEYLKGRSEEKGIVTLSDIPEIRKIFLKSLPAVCKSGGCGKSSSCSDDYCIRVIDFLLKSENLFFLCPFSI